MSKFTKTSHHSRLIFNQLCIGVPYHAAVSQTFFCKFCTVEKQNKYADSFTLANFNPSAIKLFQEVKGALTSENILTWVQFLNDSLIYFYGCKIQIFCSGA